MRNALCAPLARRRLAALGRARRPGPGITLISPKHEAPDVFFFFYFSCACVSVCSCEEEIADQLLEDERPAMTTMTTTFATLRRHCRRAI